MLKPEHIAKLSDQLKKEIDAYFAYKELKTSLNSDCKILDEAIEEIMYDEYLHARFIREYMKSKDIYKFPMFEEVEKRFQMMDED